MRRTTTLAVINQNGLWIKDIVNSETHIINATKIEDSFLKNVTITIYNNDFKIKKIISSNQVDISNKNWIIQNPIIFKGNFSKKKKDDLNYFSNFDILKINSLFKNLASLNFYQLYKLKKNYNNLNYSYEEVDIHIKKLISFPFYLSLMTILAGVIMFNFKMQKSNTLKISFGLFLSVLIYYINNFLYVLGKTEKINIIVSVWMPIFILIIINFIYTLKINEK